MTKESWLLTVRQSAPLTLELDAIA